MRYEEGTTRAYMVNLTPNSSFCFNFAYIYKHIEKYSVSYNKHFGNVDYNFLYNLI